ncbi:DUF2695 domain-containing protein [Georgenia alba]|uniref:DUF2695 domain-containing protein n=1 Tax=Georgenia alba TaxID=2233858 RepID=A0ABW2QFC0_9MICO
MSVDNGVQTLEIELASLAEDLTSPGWHECVLCYVNRMIAAFGCDGTLRWTRRWRDRQAPRATGLERRAGRVGAYCDCELFLNGWDVAVEVVPDEYRGPGGGAGCLGVRTGTTQPCLVWVRINRAAGW